MWKNIPFPKNDNIITTLKSSVKPHSTHFFRKALSFGDWVYSLSQVGFFHELNQGFLTVKTRINTLVVTEFLVDSG